MGIKTLLHYVFMNISFRFCIIFVSMLFTHNFIFHSTYAQNKNISESSISLASNFGSSYTLNNEYKTSLPDIRDIKAPEANFSGSPESGTVPLTVSFTDKSKGTISKWSWDFGDGSSSTEHNPSHTFSNPGKYTIKLTVTGPGGSDTKTMSDYITVNYPPPVADFSGTPESGTAPLSVSFTDKSKGTISKWSWNFGDGSSSTEQNPSHTFSNPGKYTIKLIVTGKGGSSTKTRSDYIVVIEPSLEVSTNFKEINREADSLEISIKSNINWAVSTNAYWLYMYPLSGYGNGTFKIYYDPVSSTSTRYTLIFVSGENLIDTIILKQPGLEPSLEVSTKFKEINREADSLEINIKSNLEWSISTNAYWLYMYPLSGYGDGIFKIYYDPVKSTSTRYALIFVSGENLIDTITLKQPGITTGINSLEYISEAIRDYYLTNNFPNPFNPQTSIEFGIPEESNNTLMIFDINGRSVKTIFQNKILQRGQFRYRFNADNLPSGVYILVLTSSSIVSDKTFKGIKKMILLK